MGSMTHHEPQCWRRTRDAAPEEVSIELLLRRLMDRRGATIGTQIGHRVALHLTGAELDLIVMALNDVLDGSTAVKTA